MTVPIDNSFGNILKSTVMLGMARMATVVIGMMRIKAIAVLLGPTGIGLFGTLEIIVTMAVYLFGLGTASSGVREIAVVRNNGDPHALAVRIRTLHRLSWILGTGGMIGLALLAVPLSTHSFGGILSAQTILILSPAILLTTVECGYHANLKGLQRTRELTLLTVVAALLSSITTIAVVAQAGSSGVVLAAVASSLVNFGLAGWLVRHRGGHPGPVAWKESWRATGTFVRLGISLTSALLMSTGVTYASRSVISAEISLAAVGIYLCAFTLSGKFVAFILDAMKLDFFPRLSAAFGRPEEFNRIINDQTEVVLLLAIPGLFGTMTFAPFLIELFYSADFLAAAPLMVVFTMGCLWRVLGAPLGFVRVAAARGALYFWTEALTNGLHLVLILVLLSWFGLVGVAWAYFLHGIFQTGVLIAISHHISGFAWSRAVKRCLGLLLPTMAVMYYVCNYRTPAVSLPIGGLTTLVSGWLACRGLSRRLPPEHRINRLLRRYGLAGQ